MESTALAVAGLIVLTVVLDGSLKKAGGWRRQFPWCRKCGSNMRLAPLESTPLPYKVHEHLIKHNLPKEAVSRYVCPKGHTQIWHMPKLGNTDKGLFIVRDC